MLALKNKDILENIIDGAIQFHVDPWSTILEGGKEPYMPTR